MICTSVAVKKVGGELCVPGRRSTGPASIQLGVGVGSGLTVTPNTYTGVTRLDNNDRRLLAAYAVYSRVK